MHENNTLFTTGIWLGPEKIFTSEGNFTESGFHCIQLKKKERHLIRRKYMQVRSFKEVI
jgi:hypothetical protein